MFANREDEKRIVQRQELTLDEGPVGLDGLTKHRSTIQVFNGTLGVLVSLILHKGVSLDESSTTVDIHVEILDGTILGAEIQNILLLGLLVDSSKENDPSLNRYKSVGQIESYKRKDQIQSSPAYHNVRRVPPAVRSPSCEKHRSHHGPFLYMNEGTYQRLPISKVVLSSV